MSTRRLLILFLILPSIIVTCQAQSSAAAGRLATPNPQRPDAASLFRSLPLAFEPNQGQFPGPAKFVSHASGYDVRVMSTELEMVFKGGGRSAQSSTMTVEFTGAREPLIVTGSDLLPGKSNYYIGLPANWHVGVPQYKAVKAAEIYPGIDLIYYGNQRQLEFDFAVAPGAAADHIRFRLDDSTDVAKDSAGSLVARAAGNKVVFQQPLAYQDSPSGRQIVDAKYEIDGSEVQIRLGAYDHSRQLIIDPVVAFATFIGGNALDTANGVATDSAGTAYMAGHTCSATGLPSLTNTYNGNCDAYVTAIKADGTAAIYTTYIGGSNGEAANAIAAEADGTVAVVGLTNTDNSTNPPFPFPITANAFQHNYGGLDNDGFLSVLDPSGHLSYSTYLGGNQNDVANNVVFDNSGNIIVVGQTGSSDFPETCGSILEPSFDGFISEFDVSTGYSTLVFSRYFPVSAPVIAPFACDSINAVALDLLGDIYVAGTTIPKCQVPDNRTAFAAKIARADTCGTVYGWIDLQKPSQGLGIAVDSLGDAILAGNSGGGALLWKINPLGSDFLFSKVIADSSTANAVALDDNGFIYVAGTTTLAAFPVVSPTQPILAGAEDAFLLKMDPSGSAMIFSTFFGGGGSDFGNSIALSSDLASCGSAAGSRCIYVAGSTYSADLPIENALQPTYGGNGDAFLAKWTGLSLPYASLSCSAPGCPLQINFGDQAVGTISAIQTITLKNLGDAPLEIFGINAAGQFAQTHSCGTFLQPNTSCTINVTFAPTSTGIQTGAVTVVDNAGGGTQSVNLTGNGTSGTGGGGGGGGGGTAAFALALSPTSTTVLAGKSATLTLTVTGLAQNVGFTCPGLPATVSCSFSPSSVSVSSGSPATVTVTLATQPRAALMPGPFDRPTFYALINTQLSFGLLGAIVVAGRRRSWRRKLVMICGLLLLLATLISCGTSSKDVGSGTQPGTYAITLTAATSGSSVVSHSVQATLTVQ